MNLDRARAVTDCIRLLTEAVDLAGRHEQRGRGDAEWFPDAQAIALLYGVSWTRDVFTAVAATATAETLGHCFFPLQGARWVATTGPGVVGVGERLDEVFAILMRSISEVRH